jgi:ribosomal protein S5
VVKATMDALLHLIDARTMASRRGIKLSELFGASAATKAIN